MKVFYQTNIPSPYRMDFLNELGKKCDLTAVFGGNTASDRDESWFTGHAEHFHCIFLNGRQVGSEQFFCPGIVKLLSQKWDKIILGGYADPTAMLAISYLRLRGIPFYMELDGGLIREEGKIKYLIKRHFASSAKIWFSSGDATTKCITYYGADPARCCKYPFSSLRNADLAAAVQAQDADVPYLPHPLPAFPDTDYDAIRTGWNPESYIARREILRQSARKRLGIPEENIILSVGHMLPGKGFDTVLKALPNRNCALYIVGGEATDELRAIIAEKGLTNVHFIPFAGKDLLGLYYRAADLFVLATRSDVWGLVINEAMANGLPIITTYSCVAGVELVEEGKNGYLVDAEDVSGLAKDMDLLLASPENQKQFGAESYHKILGYTIEQMAARHFEILEST